MEQQQVCVLGRQTAPSSHRGSINYKLEELGSAAQPCWSLTWEMAMVVSHGRVVGKAG